MTPVVSIITAALPERRPMLDELRATVNGQTFKDFQHLIEFDEDREGCSVVVNRLVAEATGEWLFLIADDDLMLPRCLEAHLAAANWSPNPVDVVYSPPLVTGNEDRWWFYQAPPAIPATALIRKQLWDDLGGYDEDADREEDRKLWIQAVEAGARFARVDEPTWVYRQHAGNKSFRKQLVAA